MIWSHSFNDKLRICFTIMNGIVQYESNAFRSVRHPMHLLYPRHLCRRVYSFRLSVRPFVCSFVRSFVRTSVTFVEFASKFCVKVSQVVYISATTYQKAFIFGP